MAHTSYPALDIAKEGASFSLLATQSSAESRLPCTSRTGYLPAPVSPAFPGIRCRDKMYPSEVVIV